MTNQTQKVYFKWNIILLFCAIACLVCYDMYGGLWLKGLTSCWFVLLGFVNLIYAHNRNIIRHRFLFLIEAGLLLGMCADILLGVQFILGILSFALGHVMYLAAFYSLEKFQIRDLYITVPIAAVSLYIVTGTPYIQIEDPFIKKLLLAYAVIIACMLGKAISNVAAKRSMSRWLVLIGSAMFWFSDLMLAIDMFGEGSRLTWILCSYMYWPAQNILAFSLFHFVNESTVGKEELIS